MKNYQKAKNCYKKLLTQIAYRGKKRITCFQIKDTSKFDSQHDLVYHAKCPSELCDKNYIGKSGRPIAERVKDHNGKDHKSYILKHSFETGHEHVTSPDFSISSKNFNGNKRKQKITGSLVIKQLLSTLNIHDKSVPMKISLNMS